MCVDWTLLETVEAAAVMSTADHVASVDYGVHAAVGDYHHEERILKPFW